ncbi:alpha/beta fold hydrolase [Lysobacter terrae]
MSEMHVEDADIQLADGQTFVRRWHPAVTASSTPIVLLHDSLGSVEQWRDFPAQLAQRLQRTVIAYDRPGFGRSSRRDDKPNTDFIAGEARVHFPALRRALGLADFGLFGHSVGGAMAIVIAALQGEACRFVVTESAQAFVESRTLEGIRTAKALFADPAQFARLAKWHGERARWVLEAWTEVWLDPVFAAWSLDAWLPQVRCPVLAIHGDRDEYGSRAFPERIVGAVSGPAQLALLDDCGHVPHRERPDEVLDRVAAFAATHATEGA